MTAREDRFRVGASGHVLIAVTVATVVISGMIYSSTLVAYSEMKSARIAFDRLEATTAADAGVERTIHHLRAAIKKTAFVDPFLGVKALLSDGAGGYKTYHPYTAEPLLDGTQKIGEFSVEVSGTDRGEGIDITITSTGFYPASPSSLGAERSPIATARVRATIRLETRPSTVFDNAYFINNWGWFYGNSIFCHGNARSNGQFDAGNYRPTIDGQPTYDALAWSGGNADLQGYHDDNGDGLEDGNDGGIFSSWDIVRAQNVRGNGGRAANQHDFEDPVKMPNLTDLSAYEARAHVQAGQIKINGSVVCDGVCGDDPGESPNLYLHGTASNPIEISGTNVVRGHVIISGVVKGQGAIYSGGNTYVPDDLTYANGPSTPRPAGNTEVAAENWLTRAKDKDFLGLFARESIVLGDHTNGTWRYYVGSWLGHPLNVSAEDSGSDGIPNTAKGRDGVAGTADDDVLEDDGVFTTEVYSAADQARGLIPPGKSVGEPIPGTGEDIDGDGAFDGQIGLMDLDLGIALTSSNWEGNMPAGGIARYSDIASIRITKLDAAFYTNHAFAWLTVPRTRIDVNGAIVSRNESIVYGGPGIHMNYDARLLGGNSGMTGNVLPRSVAPISILSWTILE